MNKIHCICSFFDNQSLEMIIKTDSCERLRSFLNGIIKTSRTIENMINNEINLLTFRYEYLMDEDMMIQLAKKDIIKIKYSTFWKEQLLIRFGYDRLKIVGMEYNPHRDSIKEFFKDVNELQRDLIHSFNHHKFQYIREFTNEVIERILTDDASVISGMNLLRMVIDDFINIIDTYFILPDSLDNVHKDMSTKRIGAFKFLKFDLMNPCKNNEFENKEHDPKSLMKDIISVAKHMVHYCEAV